MQKFEPDYRNIWDAANNRQAKRLPLYEHSIAAEHMETVLNKKFIDLYYGDDADKLEYFRNFCEFFKVMGYDTVTFEACVGPVMPGSGSLGGHVDPVIKTREDFEKYPWDEVPDLYFKQYARDYEALRKAMPAGMKAIGGVGNGIFECVQDVTGYMDLCYMAADDPTLYADMFSAAGRTNAAIWESFLREFGDVFCVVRFGDDMGHKSNLLLSSDDVRKHILPQYKKIVRLTHEYKKPFLLHSCGCIFDIMDDLIDDVRINAKHSNEDQIAPFPFWVEKYGDRIGNFGGIDTDAVCRLDKESMTEYIHEVIAKSEGHGGFAFGSGNSIPKYVPIDQYRHMVETVRRYRGDF